MLQISKYSFLLLPFIPLAAGAAAGVVPDVNVPAPRTWIVNGQHDNFRQFALAGDGAASFNRIRADFDRYWLDYPFPDEPPTYGDPDPRKRTSDKVDLWRNAQDVSNRVATVAEAAALIWIVTGESAYLDKAREFLLRASEWGPDGVSDIYYNDEAHFRLWRKLPMIYDQIRDQLSAEEKSKLLASFEVRGRRSAEWILSAGVMELKRNSVEKRPSSHPVRFMAMMGLTGLALYDDLPEAREWYETIYRWYRDIFTPWGGDDGGWAEGVGYWRGVYEHANFQDALLAIGDPAAYRDSFWKNTGYFQVYTVQPYRTTGFGDLSNAGKFNMEPGVAHFIRHLGRVLDDGYLVSYANLYSDPRPLPGSRGMPKLDRLYPTETEYLVREFIASSVSNPAPENLAELDSTRHFSDIGWVAMHSALGSPEDDIQLLFKSSPYGSFSHSHADQNAFILNAYGTNLAINSGYREYHRSLHHRFYVRQSHSKNMLLIDMRGQEVQTTASKGQIVHFEQGDRYAWAAGDATEAYQLLQARKKVVQARRDVVFIDDRYFVMKDHIRMDTPSVLSWLLHAEQQMKVDDESNSITIENEGAFLHVKLHSPENDFLFRQRTGFDIDVDPKYKDPEFVAEAAYLVETAEDQWHLGADLATAVSNGVIWSVLWPSKNAEDADKLELEWLDADTVLIHRPDGDKDKLSLTADTLELTQP